MYTRKQHLRGGYAPIIISSVGQPIVLKSTKYKTDVGCKSIIIFYSSHPIRDDFVGNVFEWFHTLSLFFDEPNKALVKSSKS